MRRLYFLTFLLLFVTVSCVQKPKEKTGSEEDTIIKLNAEPPVAASVSVVDNKFFIITGSNLSRVNTVRLTQGSTIRNLNLINKTDNQLTVSFGAFTNLVSEVLSTLVVSNAYGSATVPVSFTILDGSITTAKLSDSSVTADKLNNMGAATGEVLVFNGTTWTPQAIGTSLNFQGTYNPNLPTDPDAAPNDGDFWIIDTAGTRTFTNAQVISFNIGQWVVWDNDTNLWSRIDIAAAGNFWAKLSNDLYYTTGRVAIGQNTQTTALTVANTNTELVLDTTYHGEVLRITGNTSVHDPTGTRFARTIGFGMGPTLYSTTGVYKHTDGTNRFFIYPSSGSATPWDDASSFHVWNNGNVGIGTGATIPAEKLDVQGSGVFTGNVTAAAFIGDGSALTGVVASNVVENGNAIVHANQDAAGGEDILFQNGGTTVAIIDETGKFSVGHDNAPSQSLDIRDNGSSVVKVESNSSLTSTLDLQSSSGTIGTNAATTLNTYTGAVNFSGYDGAAFAVGADIRSQAAEAYSATNNGTRMIFRTTPTGAAQPLTEALRIAPNGNVGIGVAADPTVALEVDGNIDVDDIASNNLVLATGLTSPAATINALTVNAASTFSGGNFNFNTGQFFVEFGTGNVGINDNDPDAALDVTGNSAFRDNLLVEDNLTVQGNVSIGGDLSFTSNVLTIESATGEVGINNTNPNDALDVVGTAQITGSVNLGSTLALSGAATFSNNLLVSGDITGNSNLTLSSGNLDVTGTGTFSNTLTVGSPATTGGASIANTDGALELHSGNDATSFIDFKGSANLGSDYVGRISHADGTGFQIMSTGTERLGIGVTPDQALDVDGNVEITGDFRASAASAASPSYSFSTDTNSGMYSGGADTLRFVTAGGNRMTISSGGSVGIATTVPDSRLHIAGTTDASLAAHGLLLVGPVTGQNLVIDNNEIISRNNGSNATLTIQQPGGATAFGGDVTAPAYLYSSDRRLKKLIEPIDNPIDKIEALNGVNFVWKKTGKEDVGFIAQEVKEVFPELVNEGDDGFLAVQYGNIVAVLVEAVKEQQEQIEANKEMHKILTEGFQARVNREIASLKEENKKLKERVDLLEKKLERLDEIEKLLKSKL